ncbi:hypothetical protein LXL04_036817 [Taraxacum kok-saghyz]
MMRNVICKRAAARHESGVEGLCNCNMTGFRPLFSLPLFLAISSSDYPFFSDEGLSLGLFHLPNLLYLLGGLGDFFLSEPQNRLNQQAKPVAQSSHKLKNFQIIFFGSRDSFLRWLAFLHEIENRKIVDWLAETFKRDEGIDLLKDKQVLQRLNETAEKAKKELSTLTQTNIRYQATEWLKSFGNYLMLLDVSYMTATKKLIMATLSSISGLASAMGPALDKSSKVHFSYNYDPCHVNGMAQIKQATYGNVDMDFVPGVAEWEVMIFTVFLGFQEKPKAESTNKDNNLNLFHLGRIPNQYQFKTIPVLPKINSSKTEDPIVQTKGPSKSVISPPSIVSPPDAGECFALATARKKAMALLMEKGAEPQTEKELADLDAINAIKESAALELKEEGNKYVKMGKKHYSDAINCYTRAINQKALSDLETSQIFSNRAHVNLQLGNYGRALSDSEEAIKLSSTNVKAFYRAAKASLSLNKLIEAQSFCVKGLDHNPDNVELKKLCEIIDSQISERQQHEAQVSKALTATKELVSAIEDRGLKIGKAMFQELTGLKKPILDKDRILHWPVLLLYAEVMSSDFIEDFCETDMFSAHLDLISFVTSFENMFSDSGAPLAWDKENAYTRDAIELYYEAGSGVILSKKEIISNFLQGTVASHLETYGDDETDSVKSSASSVGGSKWVKVNERRTLHSVLNEEKLVIPGIPVFFVVSKRSKSFYKEFKSGNWSLPS